MGGRSRVWVGPALALVLLGAGCSGDDEDGITGTDSATPANPGNVVEVIDGDTFDVRLVDGTIDRVRIIGINSPERGECFADAATDALADLVSGHDVDLVADRSDRDRFDRLLRYVEVDGADVGEALVRAGAAVVRVSAPDEAREAALTTAQAEARDAGRGLWAPDACGSVDPSAAALRIAELRLDADGDDASNPNDEWVALENDGAEPVDLAGWGVRDESASHRFAFPDGFVLGPGATVRVRSGCGDPTPTDLFWCESGSAIWNNDGDTAFLLDPSGNVAKTRTEPVR